MMSVVGHLSFTGCSEGVTNSLSSVHGYSFLLSSDSGSAIARQLIDLGL